nr:MAG TPA: hypothetical protein [Caudoviricetes sp.]
MTNKYNNILHRFRVYDHETSRLEKSKLPYLNEEGFKSNRFRKGERSYI